MTSPSQSVQVIRKKQSKANHLQSGLVHQARGKIAQSTLDIILHSKTSKISFWILNSFFKSGRCTIFYMNKII